MAQPPGPRRQSRMGIPGTVEFVVYYRHQGAGADAGTINFVREAGRWYYVDGLRLPPSAMGRNDPCCGQRTKSNSNTWTVLIPCQAW
ncbi:MAG: hypothetical protein R2932_17570 [Caldilineaceae bacterium]